MGRSVKKGPFTDTHLEAKLAVLAATNEKREWSILLIGSVPLGNRICSGLRATRLPRGMCKRHATLAAVVWYRFHKRSRRPTPRPRREWLLLIDTTCAGAPVSSVSIRHNSHRFGCRPPRR